MPFSELFKRANLHIPGGVNSPVRAFNGVGGNPIFFKSASGAYLVDLDDKHYIDYVGSWGPMILGHNHSSILKALEKQLKNAISFGAPTLLEIEIAEKINTLMPNIEMIRMVNSGTEATMSAIRLARGATKRDKIVKFAGCYHGHSDSLLVSAGSGVLTLGIPGCPGIPDSFAEHTLTADFNNLANVESIFEKYGKEIAAIIIEPVAGNMGCIPPAPGFLKGLRQICDHYGSLLIFDEVMTGFRVALGGATQFYGIEPDLITLGKIIGGGLPVGAFGGRKELMEQIAPRGPIYQAGTLSGNPLAMAAGLATLTEISKPGFYESLEEATNRLVSGLNEIAYRVGVPIVINSVCGMFTIFFTAAKQVTSYQDVMACNVDSYKQFFHHMLANGIYLAPSAFECAFLSSAHQMEELDSTLEAAENSFLMLQTVKP